MVAVLIYWFKERRWTSQAISSIVDPKKKYGEVYRRGEKVQARHGGGIYPGVIVGIGDTRDELKPLEIEVEDIVACGNDELTPEQLFNELKLRALSTAAQEVSNASPDQDDTSTTSIGPQVKDVQDVSNGSPDDTTSIGPQVKQGMVESARKHKAQEILNKKRNRLVVLDTATCRLQSSPPPRAEVQLSSSSESESEQLKRTKEKSVTLKSRSPRQKQREFNASRRRLSSTPEERKSSKSYVRRSPRKKQREFNANRRRLSSSSEERKSSKSYVRRSPRKKQREFNTSKRRLSSSPEERKSTKSNARSPRKKHRRYSTSESRSSSPEEQRESTPFVEVLSPLSVSDSDDDMWKTVVRKLSGVETKFKGVLKDLKELREENQQIKKRLRKLEKNKKSKEEDEEEDIIFGDCSKKDVGNIIRNESRMQVALKRLLLEVFGEEYVVSHSMTGRPGNSNTPAKPIIDPDAMGFIRGAIKNKFAVSDQDISAKVLNIQKALRLKKSIAMEKK